MPYGETKVYCDGSHYIAIPHTTRPSRPRRQRNEEVITVTKEVETQEMENSTPSNEDVLIPHTAETVETEQSGVENLPIAKPANLELKMTRRELFNKLYAETANEPKCKRQKKIVDAMRSYFKSEYEVICFVNTNFERKYRNLVSRRIRLLRKVNLHEFNYFVTFTYDNALHTEVTFRKKLKNTLSHLCSRKLWRYVGVWERSPNNKRLHFHGIFHIPDGSLPGKTVDVNSYSFSMHKRQITKQNEYFLKEFGRNDFEPLDDKRHIGDAVAYILKYIEKSGEKIVYSRGLPQYFISDIMDEDIVCPFGLEDKKLLLFDDFNCWDDGCLMGKIGAETIDKMRKSN